MTSPCGQTFYLHPSGVIPPHKRDDVVARLKRGDSDVDRCPHGNPWNHCDIGGCS